MYKIKIWDTEVEGEKLVVDHEVEGVCLMMDGVAMEHDEDSKVAAMAYFGKGSSAGRMATALTRGALEECSPPIRRILMGVMEKRNDKEYMDKLMRLILLDLKDILKDEFSKAWAEE